jgi:hypothetical protein
VASLKPSSITSKLSLVELIDRLNKIGVVFLIMFLIDLETLNNVDRFLLVVASILASTSF